MKFSWIFAPLFSMLFLGCASKEEVQERKENAFNLEGSFGCKKQTGSGLNMLIKITPEGSKSDVLINIERTSFSSAEIALLHKYNLNPQSLSTLFEKNIVLGKGAQFSNRGGENISSDFGESSQLNAYSDSYIDPTRKITIHYDISGSIRKSDYILRGSLTMSIEVKVPAVDENGKPIEKTILENVTFTFAGDPGVAFYTQYFGSWSGKVEATTTDAQDFTSLTSFEVAKIDETFFQTRPIFATAINYNGMTFNYVPEQFSMNLMKDFKVPEISMEFMSLTKQKIIFFGEIWSLGNLTGSVIFINGTTETPLGNFQFKKN